MDAAARTIERISWPTVNARGRALAMRRVLACRAWLFTSDRMGVPDRIETSAFNEARLGRSHTAVSEWNSAATHIDEAAGMCSLTVYDVTAARDQARLNTSKGQSP